MSTVSLLSAEDVGYPPSPPTQRLIKARLPVQSACTEINFTFHRIEVSITPVITDLLKHSQSFKHCVSLVLIYLTP